MLKRLARLFGAGGVVSGTPAGAARVAQDVDALLAPASAALEAGSPQRAVELLEALLENHPDLAEAHLLLGTLHHRRKNFEDARDSYLLATCHKPEWWRPHYRLGVLGLDQGKFGDALETLRKAVALEANVAHVHNALGAALLRTGNALAAVDEFRKALALEPDFPQAHSNLGYALFKELEQYDEGAQHIERALELAPSDAAASCNRIMLLSHYGRFDDALALADALLARDAGFFEARLNKALVLLGNGDFERAWPDYEARKLSLGDKCTSDFPSAEWDGSSLAGRSIFVYPEQGLGDEIMFASCVPELVERSGACTIECHPKLEPIFRRSFPRAEILAKDAWRRSQAFKAQPPDWKVAVGSLPRFFRRARAEFPPHRGYLRADEAKAARWKARLADLPGHAKVGISWRGGLATTRRGLRSIPLEQWTPVLSVPGIDFVSLQYADPEREIEAVGRRDGIEVHHWPEAIDDYDETAALVASLDLVVSVQTAIVHLAGALGSPTWALIPAAPEWRYGAEGVSMPWYPAVRLIRQTISGEWGGVMEALGHDLRAWSQSRGS